jgi:hypothetical protein
MTDTNGFLTLSDLIKVGTKGLALLGFPGFFDDIFNIKDGRRTHRRPDQRD